MDQWIILGHGHYLSDIIDNIHNNGGHVAAIVSNIEPDSEQLADLERRISLTGYDIPVIRYANYRPEPGDRHCYGFIKGREPLMRMAKQNANISFPRLIHPTAILGANVEIGEGVIIGPGTIIAPNCHIGDFTLINRGISIGHDTEIGEFATIGPRSAIAGMVKIGRNTTVGIGATVIDGVTIGENSFVGAGAVVVGDVPDNVVVVGVPAKVLRKNKTP
jgi:sugar O-acyltransferase (sialic acid O-acetyltransferase NeuD family)